MQPFLEIFLKDAGLARSPPLQEVQNAAFQLTFLNTNFFGTNKLNYRVSKKSKRCIPSMLNISCELTDGELQE